MDTEGSTMSEVCWALDLINMSAMGQPKLTTGISDLDDAQERLDKIKYFRQRGELIPDEFMPRKQYSRYSDVKAEIKSDLFLVGGKSLGVSQKVYDVIKDFDYGGGGLTPFEVFEFDRVTKAKKVTDDYYTLNFAGNKQAILPEKSVGLRFKEPLNMYGLPRSENYELFVSSKATQGSDVWIDPKIMGAIFLSSRFIDAVKSIKPKAKGRFPLFKCKVQ